MDDVARLYCHVINLKKVVESTHPVYASLDHPLFGFAGKRGFPKIVKKVFTLFPS
jgi:hypothetical protein